MIKPLPEPTNASEESLNRFEKETVIKLPAEYRDFINNTNGGFPSPNKNCIEISEGERKSTTDVLVFFAIDDNREWLSISWHLSVFSDRIPEQTLPIARDSHGNLWLLGVGVSNSGFVYFWDHGSYDTFDETNIDNWPRITKSFKGFMEKLAKYNSNKEKNAVLSRYGMVHRATKKMKGNDAAFDSHANPGYVWHCDCDDKGGTTMQFVDYRIHASTTHTDGYSRLCAIKGLIKDGPTRMPKTKH